VADELTRRRAYPAIARPAFGIVLVMVLMMAGAGFAGVRIFDSLEQLHDSASRAGEEASAVGEVLDALQDSETAVRGFLLTMRSDYLAPYEANHNRMEEGLRRLDALAVDSPWLRDELGALHGQAEARMAEIDRTLALDRSRGPDAALAAIMTDQGRHDMEMVHATCDRIQTHAIAEREERTAQLIARERETLYVVMAAALAGTLLLGFAALGLLMSRTRQMWAQAALSTQSGRLQAAVEHIRDGVAVFDAADRLIVWNPSFFPIGGLPARLAAAGTPFASFVAAAGIWDPPLLGRPGAGGNNAATIDADAAAAEVRVGERVLEVWRGAMPDGGHILAVADITRRTRAEAIARQAQKMEALGQLTGGVAHDFNNLLQIIAANLELLDVKLPTSGEDADWLRARVQAARAGVERGARLVRHLLAFARRQPLAPEVTDPVRLLRGMEEMLQRALGPVARVELAIPDQVWSVLVDPQQLENAVLNLAINGRDAIEAAGVPNAAVLRIMLTHKSVDAASAAHQGVQAGDYVCVSVVDSGAGMTEETIARAVEPFFTTKGEGKGTGLGLPMVYGFARQSGGAMQISSTPGRGTTVALLIPRTSDKQRPARTEGTANGPRRPRIVLAEDDRPVRVTTAELLCGLGYDVTQAATAAEALALLDQDTDVLMTDIGLPDMDGRDLAREALSENPDLAVVIASGEAAVSPPDDPRIAWLNKPYSVGGLAAAIDRVTAGRGRARRLSDQTEGVVGSI
jgi:signal transduction histidine kinase/ActR/RegA family two-component response regulator